MTDGNGKPHTKPAIIVDSGDLRKYRTELPNLLRHLDLNPFEGWLYFILKSVCGANTSVELSTRDMAELSNMSVGKVSECKQSLKAKRLITVTERAAREKDIVVINDIWLVNFAYLSNYKHFKEQDLQPSLFPESSFMQAVSASVTVGIQDAQDLQQKPSSPVSSKTAKSSVHTVNSSVHTVNTIERNMNRTNIESNKNTNTILANADLPGLSAREIVFNAVAEGCGYTNPKALTAKDRAIIYNAVDRLFILNEGVSGERIARRVIGFSLWQRSKVSGGVNFDYPNPDTMVRKWQSYVDFVNNHLNGNLPTIETFEDLKALQSKQGGNGNGKVTGR